MKLVALFYPKYENFQLNIKKNVTSKRHETIRNEPVEPRAPELGHTRVGHNDTTEEIEDRDDEWIQQGSNLNIRRPGGNHLSQSNSKDDKDLEHQVGIERRDGIGREANSPVEDTEENSRDKEEEGQLDYTDRQCKRFPAVVFARLLPEEPLTFRLKPRLYSVTK